ncbi:transcriptional regulator [Xaviernesmea oryzae]|uniref:Transcriptional regulator n=1 Tax=Xaviernesmea oryzae TaxID=464029 RepID=A0A1Q9B0A1_9HYPH|nr:Hpt domain-containing protein [Xaviernesmea oryzae]OLP61407.1 transcriptional regulator [Xaviernesmea oryzae]SEL70367.1 Hpt domain-containing protein [Xaviernesmea oryzae]
MALPASLSAFDAPQPDRALHPTATRPIDLDHLTRQTMGDKSLELEVLQLFARQARQVLKELESAAVDQYAPLAHRLKGAALAIGATEVTAAAHAVENGQTGAEHLATLNARVLDCELFILKLCR